MQPLECKELGDIYRMDKPPLLYLRVFRRLSEKHTNFAHVIRDFVVKTKITIWAESTNGFSP